MRATFAAHLIPSVLISLQMFGNWLYVMELPEVFPAVRLSIPIFHHCVLPAHASNSTRHYWYLKDWVISTFTTVAGQVLDFPFLTVPVWEDGDKVQPPTSVWYIGYWPIQSYPRRPYSFPHSKQHGKWPLLLVSCSNESTDPNIELQHSAVQLSRAQKAGFCCFTSRNYMLLIVKSLTHW